MNLAGRAVSLQESALVSDRLPREREGGGGRYSHRTLKKAVALKAANVIFAANNTELMKSAAIGQLLTGDSPIVRPQLTASEPQAKTNITRGDHQGLWAGQVPNMPQR